MRALLRERSSEEWLHGKPIEIVRADVKDVESLRRPVENVDAIIHVGGVTAAKNRQGFYDGNLLPTRNLLEAARRYDPGLSRFVLCSSQTAVGPSLDGQPVTELTPPHPITTYGKSKRAAEEEAERARQDIPVTILRLAAIYGPRDTAILTFFQTVDKGLRPLIGMKDKWINLAHVSDIADASVLAVEKEEAKNQTYFIGGEQHHTWREISNLTAEVLKRRGLTVKLPHTVVYTVAGFSEFFSMFRSKPSVLNWEKGRDMVQANWTCSVEKAVRELGYHQNVSLEDGIRDTTDWYRREGWM